MNGLGLLVVGGLLVGAGPEKSPPARAAAKSITWPELKKLNYRTGKIKRSLAKKIKSPIKIHGYVLPLEGDGNGLTSFVLVSDPMYCGHVPPPPPNQLILVELRKPKPWKLFETAIWLTGRLVIKNEKSNFGGYMYKMKRVIDIEKDKSWTWSL